MERNRIQVFGLPRSGTNFIEYTIQNNFEGLEYHKLYGVPNVVGDNMSVNGKQSVKHLYPTLSYSDYVIVIYKDYVDWVRSVKKIGWDLDISYDEYMRYLFIGYSLPEDRRIIINHRWAVENYEQMLRDISDKFGLVIKDDWVQPGKKFLFNAGRRWTDEDYL